MTDKGIRYGIVWLMKDGRKLEDESHFLTEAEAETYAGIELMQFEADDVKTYKVVKI